MASHMGRVPIRRFHTAALASSAGVRATIRHSVHGHQPFRPLPAPTGAPPYRLALADVLRDSDLPDRTDADRMVFHIVGDTGGVVTDAPQRAVAGRMEAEFAGADSRAHPALLFHLGDVVYFYGEHEQYYPQFYEPYEDYPAPIFAIPGNHDGDLSRDQEANDVPSLEAFVENFCQRIAHHARDALDAHRYAMTQPNVYWTLETPRATIVGLYTNVPDGGQLDDDQIMWLQGELFEAPKDRALLVCMHHPIYSVDDHHSGSQYMLGVLDEAMARAGRAPDAVFAGHVHNYQRFTRERDGRQIPFVVAGAGGYHNLHRISRDFRAMGSPVPFAIPGESGVRLESFCDDRFGYLRLEVSAQTLHGDYIAVARDDPGDPAAAPFDSFALDLVSGRLR